MDSYRTDQEMVDVDKMSPKRPTPLDSNSSAPEESEDKRRQREEQESIELAQALMAEEAMASYQNAWELLQDSAHHLSREDYEAMRVAIAEDEREDTAEYEDEEGELSYETMLQIGERIGDVKSERWAIEARKHIDRLPVLSFDPNSAGDDDSEIKCLVCQCEYQSSEKLRRLPCGHFFHVACVDQWLVTKDVCPYCRSCIARSK